MTKQEAAILIREWLKQAQLIGQAMEVLLEGELGDIIFADMPPIDIDDRFMQLLKTEIEKQS